MVFSPFDSLVLFSQCAHIIALECIKVKYIPSINIYEHCIKRSSEIVQNAQYTEILFQISKICFRLAAEKPRVYNRKKPEKKARRGAAGGEERDEAAAFCPF
jgi:hypothetical protein